MAHVLTMNLSCDNSFVSLVVELCALLSCLSFSTLSLRIWRSWDFTCVFLKSISMASISIDIFDFGIPSVKRSDFEPSAEHGVQWRRVATMAMAKGRVAQVCFVMGLQSSIDGVDSRVLSSTSALATKCIKVSNGQRVAMIGSVATVRAGMGWSRSKSVLERPKLEQSGFDSTPQTEEGMDNIEQVL